MLSKILCPLDMYIESNKKYITYVEYITYITSLNYIDNIIVMCCQFIGTKLFYILLLYMYICIM